MRVLTAAVVGLVVFTSTSVAAGIGSDPKPTLTDRQIKDLLIPNMRNPGGVRNFKVYGPVVQGPDGWGNYRWVICASYMAQNGFGATIQESTALHFKGGQIENVYSGGVIRCDPSWAGPARAVN